MKDQISISISVGTIIKVLVLLIVTGLLFYVSEFLVALLVAVVLASAAEMPVRFLAKWGIPRGFSVISIFLALILVVVAVIFIFIPPIADDIARFIKTMPAILDSIRIFGKDMGFRDLSLAVQELSRDISKGQVLTVLKNTLFGSSGFFANASAVIGSVVNLALTFVLAFYLALEENGVQKFLRLIVPKEHEDYVTDVWSRAQHKIGMWMQGQLLLSVLVALLVYIPMLILDMPYASLLALLAFFGELIPVVGLSIATVPALFIAWIHGGTSLLGIVALIYIIIGQLENHVLYPKVMNKMVGVPSVVVIIALVIGAKLAGIWGVLLAVPVAAILMEFADDVRKKKDYVGE
ncbi:MAG: AI-2E family transporter [Candidatus Pacebacteria bacterium]|nr:AI-2E family transporter [Candidatus Paceibacterota bacterium]